MATDRYVIIIGGGILTVPAIEKAREMGFKTIVFDRDRGAPGMKLADASYLESTKDPEGCVASALDAARARDIKGVLTCGADVEVTVAAIAEALHLPGIPVEVATLCNDKFLMRGELTAASVPSPRWGAGMLDEPSRYPVVVKPLRACGSRGVSLAKDYAEYERARDWALQFDKSTMVEEYIPGTTHTVELLFSRSGLPFLVSIIDTHHSFSPYFVETHHNNPSRRGSDEQVAMYGLAVKTAAALGVNFGPFKVDIIYNEKRGPFVMEVTARLSGGFHSTHTTPLAHGSDNVRAAIGVATGWDWDRDVYDGFNVGAFVGRHASCHALFSAPGRVKSIEGVVEAQEVADYIFIQCTVGDVIPEYRSSADRRAFVIVSGDTAKECDEKAARVKGMIKIETEEVS